MKYLKASILLLLVWACKEPIQSQKKDITSSLYETYEDYKEPSLDKRRIKHEDIIKLLEEHRDDSEVEIHKVGESIEGRSLNLVSLGNGNTDVFLWSQMHGNEPTATQAIFDILNFFKSSDFQEEKSEILSNLRLHFLPMLNPDGAEVFKRENRLGIDINRDALRLQSPEGQTLKRVRDSLQADFGFNLHDQSTYYNAERTEKPATISYLAPAYNYEKDVDEGRGNAMKVIVFMNRIIQQYAPGQVGRYNDDFEPRAFGDNIQKWGTSTVLIESGGWPGDPNKMYLRKLNTLALLWSFLVLGEGSYAAADTSAYESLPFNMKFGFDLLVRNVSLSHPGGAELTTADIGLNLEETFDDSTRRVTRRWSVEDIGDLSTFTGHTTIDMNGAVIDRQKVALEAKLTPEMLKTLIPLK